MMTSLLPGFLLAVLILLAIVSWRQRHRRSRPGPGAAGSLYGFLNEDKRAALEIVVAEHAGYRDPEDRDGDLPQLEIPVPQSPSARDDQ
jgi:hypothetical protein